MVIVLCTQRTVDLSQLELSLSTGLFCLSPCRNTLAGSEECNLMISRLLVVPMMEL